MHLAYTNTMQVCTYVVGSIFYNLFLHPLRKFPGPKLHAATTLTKSYYTVAGTLPFKVTELHEAYDSNVIRIAPNELAFRSPQAWRDIYSHKTAGQPEWPKYDGFYRAIPMPTSIISAGREEHSALRRQIAHGFSERSMRGQEPIIGVYVDLLVQRMRAVCEDPFAKGAGIVAKNGSDSKDGATFNMREWLNWATFDVIGDLGFGSPFGCLEASDYHPWVRIITDSIRQGAYLQAVSNVGLRGLSTFLVNSGVLRKRTEHQMLVANKLKQRMEQDMERPDLIEGLIRKKDTLFVSSIFIFL